MRPLMLVLIFCRKLLIAAVSLLPIFGLTWVFGLLAVNEETIAFAWIFTILNSVQVINKNIYLFGLPLDFIGFIYPILLRLKK